LRGHVLELQSHSPEITTRFACVDSM
jgi:hypothetical protein